jgi:hypothetical protein
MRLILILSVLILQFSLVATAGWAPPPVSQIADFSFTYNSPVQGEGQGRLHLELFVLRNESMTVIGGMGRDCTPYIEHIYVNQTPTGIEEADQAAECGQISPTGEVTASSQNAACGGSPGSGRQGGPCITAQQPVSRHYTGTLWENTRTGSTSTREDLWYDTTTDCGISNANRQANCSRTGNWQYTACSSYLWEQDSSQVHGAARGDFYSPWGSPEQHSNFVGIRGYSNGAYNLVECERGGNVPNTGTWGCSAG